MIQRILVAIDGSEHAQHALNYALKIAEKFDAPVHLLSVFHPLTFPYSPYPPTGATAQLMQQALNAQRQHQNKILSQAFADAHRLHSQIKLSKSLKEGRPADIIVQTAVDDQVDLIVMGSRGLGGVKQLFLGSVSDRVADEASCPVLIVK
ncbi:MAG: universal stress protein [Candidatus Bathyarchaeota archaeon]|jgi:nucleotide-binding universal stress UspA family protein|nr:universal stress protein [Candidatus Bathyarchaeota archaeon]